MGQGNSIFPYEKHEAKTDLRLSSLTSRELEILEILSQGYSNRKISGKLETSDNTVKFHLKNIYEKIQVDNRTQAVAFYKQLQKRKFLKNLISFFRDKFSLNLGPVPLI